MFVFWESVEGEVTEKRIFPEFTLALLFVVSFSVKASERLSIRASLVFLPFLSTSRHWVVVSFMSSRLALPLFLSNHCRLSENEGKKVILYWSLWGNPVNGSWAASRTFSRSLTRVLVLTEGLAFNVDGFQGWEMGLARENSPERTLKLLMVNKMLLK